MLLHRTHTHTHAAKVSKKVRTKLLAVVLSQQTIKRSTKEELIHNKENLYEALNCCLFL